MKPKECMGEFFLDSGAHSLFNKHILVKDKKTKKVKEDKKGYKFFDSDEFEEYLSDYATFIKKHKHAIDYYVNVDVIHNPEKSWEVLKRLENEYGLHPLPVIHVGTSVDWLKRHLKEGYDYIGFGGLGQTDRKRDYYSWANDMFKIICPKPKYQPIIKTHGFAMTSYDLLVKYPWTSVDSASWAKAGAYGVIYVPKMTNGKHDYMKRPYNIAVSLSKSQRQNNKVEQDNGFNLVDPSHAASTPAAYRRNKHLFTLSRVERKIIEQWLDEIEVPLGAVDKEGNETEWGVISHYQARKIANLKFFTAVQRYLTSLEPRTFNARDAEASRMGGLLY